MHSLYHLKIKINYLIFDFIIPHLLYLWHGQGVWEKVSRENFDFFFIRYSKAYSDREHIIKKYRQNYYELTKIFKHDLKDSRILVYCVPSQALSKKINKRELNFVKLNGNKIYVIYNNIETSSVKHELVHIMTYEYFGAIDSNIKLALFEGIAMAVTHSSKINTVFIKQGRVDDYALSDVIDRKVPNNIFYAYMGSLVLYLVITFGLEKFLVFCKEANFEEHYGMSLNALGKKWAIFLKNSLNLS